MISLKDLEQKLSNLYNLKCFVDLETLSTSPTSAYKHFQEFYQEVFNNNDRLVFYTTDIISDQLLKHLYQSANLIDISNFFVLICSPHNIKEQVESVAALHSSDTVPFHTLQLNFEETNKLQDNFFVSDTLCPIPWRHLEVSAKGGVRPCCVYSHTVENVRNTTLNDVFYGTAISKLRQALLDGKKPSGCNTCWNTESKGLISNRHYHMSMLKKELLTVDLDNPKIKSLDLKPGNTCNFKCRICNPVSSSLFAQELSKTYSIPVKTFNWAESESRTMTEITELLSELSNIDMYGGEPFLIKPLDRLVKQAVDQRYAKNIRLHYNSNGSVYPEKLIESWTHFKHVDIHFSIDNVGDRFELERGGTWIEVDSNIRRLLELNLPNVKISIMPTISIMNILYINEVLQWAKELKCQVNPLYVTYPSGFSLKNLTTEAKKLIFDKFQNHPWEEMKNILNYIKSNPDSDGKEFVKICQHFDNLRNQNFKNSHFEIAQAMGYVYNSNL